MKFKPFDKFDNSLVKIRFLGPFFAMEHEDESEVIVRIKPRDFNNKKETKFYEDHIKRMAKRHLKDTETLVIKAFGPDKVRLSKIALGSN